MNDKISPPSEAVGAVVTKADGTTVDSTPAIIVPEVEPYGWLLCAIKNHPLSYLIKMDPDAMDAKRDEYATCIRTGALLDLDLGAPAGLFHLPADSIAFMKRVTQTEHDAMSNADMVQRSRIAR